MKIYSNRRGLTIIQLLIWILVFGVLIAGAFILINQEKAKTRDAKRIADIVQIQAAFEFLFNDTNSYEQAASGGCDKTGDSVSKCNLESYLPDIKTFHDPSGGNYIISQVPNDIDYEVIFELEKNYKDLKAGRHTLSSAGIN